MKEYTIMVSMRAVYFDNVEIEDHEDLEDYLRSEEYELPEEPEYWENFKLHTVLPSIKETA